MMRTLRNAAAIMVIGAALLSPSPVAADECEDPPLQEWCSYWETFYACYQWGPECYMVNSYTPTEAQDECDDFAGSCGFGAEALWDGECWWTCLIEQQSE